MEYQEDTIKSFVTVILMGLSLLVALMLMMRVSGSSIVAHTVLIFMALALATLILFGVWLEEEWAYTFAILFYTAGLAHLIWLYSATRALLPFTFGILVNICGLVVAVVAATPSGTLVQTYDVKPISKIQKEIDLELEKRKSKRSTKKTSKRKTAKRKTKRKTKRARR